MTSPLPTIWHGLIDDAAIFPPGNADLGEAVAAFEARGSEWYADLVGSFVVTDTRVADAHRVATRSLPVSLVVTGGAGAISGAARLAGKRGELAGLEIAVRDLDDLPGNARRIVAAVDAARDEGLLDEQPVFVELPLQATPHGWLAAADEVAGAELRLKFRTGGLEAGLFPSAATLAGWIDAALDRETAFKCTAGLHNGVRHTSDEGFEHHGFLNVLLATAAAFDGATPDDVIDLLEQREGTALAALATDEVVGRARRWFTSYGSCSILEPLDDLTTLGLLETP